MKNSEVKIYDYNVVSDSSGAPQKELENDCVRFEFNDCYFQITVDKYNKNAITVYKIAKMHPNQDQITIKPNVNNSLVLI